VNMRMNLRVPRMTGNFLTSWATISFSRRILLRGVSHIRPGFPSNLLKNVSRHKLCTHFLFSPPVIISRPRHPSWVRLTTLTILSEKSHIYNFLLYLLL
jgi:hypothetical protein